MASVGKPALVFMLMLATAMVAHGAVLCKNELPVPIVANGVHIDVGLQLNVDLLVEVALNLVIELVALNGTSITTPLYCPTEVTKLSCVQVDGGVEVVVKEVTSALSGLLGTVGGLLDQILGLVLGFVPVKLA